MEIMIEEITIEEIAWLITCALFFFTGWLIGKGKIFSLAKIREFLPWREK